MIAYTIKKSTRARQLRVTIKADASVVVTVPTYVSMRRAERFVEEKMDWIEEKVAIMKKRTAKLDPSLSFPKGSRRDMEKNKSAALSLVNKKLAHFNRVYGFAWKNVSIKHLTSRWGSCSMKGNLNFSYKIVYLPLPLADYLIVHELCHLGEFNHSRGFWKLVEKTIPEYDVLRKQLRQLS